jgi:hypothetical protein
MYTCKQEPLHSHCNKALCKTRKYGIGSGQGTATIGGLTVVESEPPVWFVDVDGSRLELSTKQLQIADGVSTSVYGTDVQDASQG